MKDKYKKIYDDYKGLSDGGDIYDKYINITDYLKEYYNYSLDDTKPSESEEEVIAREKMEKRNNRIDQILNND